MGFTNEQLTCLLITLPRAALLLEIGPLSVAPATLEGGPSFLTGRWSPFSLERGSTFALGRVSMVLFLAWPPPLLEKPCAVCQECIMTHCEVLKELVLVRGEDNVFVPPLYQTPNSVAEKVAPHAGINNGAGCPSGGRPHCSKNVSAQNAGPIGLPNSHTTSLMATEFCRPAAGTGQRPKSKPQTWRTCEWCFFAVLRPKQHVLLQLVCGGRIHQHKNKSKWLCEWAVRTETPGRDLTFGRRQCSYSNSVVRLPWHDTILTGAVHDPLILQIQRNNREECLFSAKVVWLVQRRTCLWGMCNGTVLSAKRPAEQR